MHELFSLCVCVGLSDYGCLFFLSESGSLCVSEGVFLCEFECV